MKNRLMWELKSSQQKQAELAGLETYLSATLQPVRPRAEFVNGLQQRLLHPVVEERPALSRAQYIILGVAGTLTSLVLVITGVKATISILGKLGVLDQIKLHMQQRNASRLHPAT